MKNYTMFLGNGNVLPLPAKDGREAKKLALTFLSFKALKDDTGKTILLNMGCRR